MAGTKKKSSKGKAPSKQQPKQPKGPAQTFLEQQQLLPPQERMAAVRPLWLSLSPEEREGVLTVPLDDLRGYAKDLATRNRLAAEIDVAEALAAGHMVINLDPPVDEILELGLARSEERGTWKVWQWPPEEATFLDSDAFRKHLEDNLLGEEHRVVLPKEPEGTRPMERPSEAAFRQRMLDLMAKVQEQRVAQEEAAAAASRRQGVRRQEPASAMRDAAIDLIVIILGVLETEHEALYQHCLFPVTSFVCEILPEGSRKTTRSELFPEDLECLLPDDVNRIFDFLQEKVEALSSKLKSDAKELEQEDPNEEPIGDVDLFSLTEDGQSLRVNQKWLGHLRSRVLGEDSQPRRAKEGEDPTSAGLILEWVYGTIVSTAEKGRDAAHRALGTKPPSSEDAVEALVHALEEQSMWELHARSSRDLLAQMLESRKEAAALSEKFDIRTKGPDGGLKPAEGGTATERKQAAEAESGVVGDGLPNGLTGGDAASAGVLQELPNEAILFMLKREALLTSAKLHGLKLEQAASKRELRSLQAQLRAGEPQFERLKRELDELKAVPSRALEGTYRNTAEMERHRAQLADAAIEEQISVQAAFRKIGSRLQKVLESKQDLEVVIVKKDQEANQLNKWRRNVCTMVDTLEDLLAAAAPLQGHGNGCVNANGEVDEEAGEVDDAQRALIAAVRSATHHGEDLEALRTNFHTSIRRQLYSPSDDISIFEAVQKQLKEIERRLEDGRVAVQHLMAFAINVACDDPGITIGSSIVLPLLQERLDLKGLEWADQKAAAAQDEVMKMELISEDKQRQEKEKKAKARLKAKEKARSEKEKERADKEARERQAREAEEEARRKAEFEAEEARKRRVEELEAIRKAEEELMERRRKELLEDEDSHWRHRAQQEELLAAQAEQEQEMLRQALEDGETKERPVPAVSAATASSGGDDGFTLAAPKRGQVVRRGGQDQKERETRSAAGLSGRESSAKDLRDGGGVGEISRPGKGSQKDLRGPAAATSGGGNNGSSTAKEHRTRSQPQGPIQQQPQQQQQRQQRPGTTSGDATSSSAEPAVLPNGAAWGPPLAPTSPENVETAAAVSSSQSQSTTTANAVLAAAVPAEQPEVTSQQVSVQPPQPQHVVPQSVAAPVPGGPPPTLPPGLPPSANSVSPPPASGIPAMAISHGGMMPPPMSLPPGMVHMPLPPGAVPLPMAHPHTLPPGHGHGPHAGPGPSMHSRSGSISGDEQHIGNSTPTGVPAAGVPLPGAVQVHQGPHSVGVVPPPMTGHGPGHSHAHGHPLPHFGVPPPVVGGAPVYGGPQPPPPPPPGAPGMRPPMPMFFPHGGPMVDGNGRLIRPPPGAFVLPNGMVPPPMPPGMHMPMGPVTMGQPLPAGGRFPTRHAPPASLRQLRAAAQPFVPRSATTPRPAAAADAVDSSSAAPSADGAVPNGKAPGSPRGILEPAEVVIARTADEVASTGTSNAGSTEPELTRAESQERSTSANNVNAAPSNEQGGVNSTQAAAAGAAVPTPRGTAPAKSSVNVITVPQQPRKTQQLQQQQRSGSGSMPSPRVPPAGGWLPQPQTDGPAAFEASQQEMMLAMVGGRQGSGNIAAVPVPVDASKPAAQQTQQQQQLTPRHPVPRLPPLDPKKLRSIRGLSNSPGVYNCFLNAIVQSLWHLPAFRRALLAVTPADLQRHAANGNASARVLISLRAIFEDLSVPGSAKGADEALQKPVSPQLLREALGGSRFEHGDMHDAAEVLGELFDRLHAAEVGPGGNDPTLPRRLRVDAPQAAPPAPTGAGMRSATPPPPPPPRAPPAPATPAAAGASGSSPTATPVASTVWGNAAALKKVKRAPAPAPRKDMSMVQKLFGMEVRSTLSSNPSPRTGTSAATVEALEFTKYCHLVPAQGLRLAATTAPSFEAALVAASGGAPSESLVARPSIFTLGMVFESPQVPVPALAATLAALRPELDISKLFLAGPEWEEEGTPLRYRLRCMVCYSSSHYSTFAFSDRVCQWVLLDDAKVSPAGRWEDVQAVAASSRLQPSLLFYEAVEQTSG